MGNKDSKLLCINYEDAVKRVSDVELRRIKEAFKRSAGTNGTILSKNAFKDDVLCEIVPSVIGDWLYKACGGTQKGIAFKELLCGLVLLTRGTHEEKIKFLWNLYVKGEPGTHIVKHDFIELFMFEQSVLTTHSCLSATTDSKKSLAQMINTIEISLFGQVEKVTFDQFKSWILKHKDTTIISRWLLQETAVDLSSELEAPTFYQSLAGVTHLEEQDIGDLEKVFWLLKGSAKTGQLDLESMGPLFSPPVPQIALRGVFLAFDENRDGHIDFKELCCGVSAACRGPSVERCKFCFKIFDTDRDGILNSTEIRLMIEILLLVANESIHSKSFKDKTVDELILELQHQKQKSTYTNNNDDAKNLQKASADISVSANAAEHDDAEKQFDFTQEDFLMWNMDSSFGLVQPFLDLLFEMGHIVLGLRPQCRHLEHDIVKGWLNREVRRGYKIGQFWYLISTDWWNNWLQYTQSSPNVQCVSCKSTPNYLSNRIDEAMICDESFTSNSIESMGDLLAIGDSSSLGSGSSGISCGRNAFGPPGQIDNSSLIAANIHRNIPTLTGEGGRLRRDLTLVEHRDFELVPDSLWKALSQWYRGNLPLPRQAIQPPNTPDVELELYPLNLGILRHHVITSVNQTSTWGAVSGGYGAIPNGSYTTIASVPQVLQPPKRYLAYTAAFSGLATVKQVAEFLCQRLNLKLEDVRLWHIMSNSGTNSNSSILSQNNDSPFLLEEEHLTLRELAIKDNDQILLEIRNKDLTWPEELGSLTLNQSSSIINQERRATIASIHAPGATGLHNLGNTCFMNAALQVLFNTQPLAQYFKQNMHLYELNTTNKLGTKGQLAYKYSELLKEIWTASTRSIAPLKLRFCITKNAPQFAGGGQHDSQELLEWFLDALHEDLNRVMEKPYSELKDSNGRADAIVAAEAWLQHHSRNQSIVIDLFYGQLKSKVSCLGCGRDSVRFDPFSLLSLPLPVENYTYCEILVILLDGSIPIKYGLRLNSENKYNQLRYDLSQMCGLDPEVLLICELSASKIKYFLKDEQKIKLVGATELYAYEIPRPNAKPKTSFEMSANIEKGLKDIQRNPALLSTVDAHQLTSSSSTSTSTRSSDDNQQGLTISTDTNRRTSKVSRCFGNTICMPQTLLCFKQPSEISTSPVTNSFVHSSTNADNKTISTINLLSTDCVSVSSSLEDSQQNTINSNNCDEILNHQNHNEIVIREEIKYSSAINSISNNNSSRRIENRTNGYLKAIHRKMSRLDTYFLSHHKTRSSLFGVPLLIPYYEGNTNKDLYCAVWIQVARLLSPLPPTPPDQANHATDCDDSLGYEFPFILRVVGESGQMCAICQWSKFCRGCEIPCDDKPILYGILQSANNRTNTSQEEYNVVSDSQNRKTNGLKDNEMIKFGYEVNKDSLCIAIDWDPTALHLRYQSTREKIWTEHCSVEICRKQQTEPVDLDHCLRAFTTEEKLEQCYHCSHCKGKQPATKKLQIWKLPPILIIHLKRFNCVNNKWVKSQKVVNFPFENFDPTPYLASVPQETILRHQELLQNVIEEGSETSSTKSANILNYDCEEEITKFDLEDHVIDVSQGNNNEKTGQRLTNGHIKMVDETDSDDNETCTACENHDEVVKKSENKCNATRSRRPTIRSMEKRKRLESSSLSKTPVIDGEFIDFHKHRLKPGNDPLNLKYKLYAVVSHSGMLNGGHYISYASNPNGSWYCYNDSSCREISGHPNIDPGCAYLLFYERQGLNYGPYLPSVEGKSIPNGNLLESDDNDNDIRKLCVLA